MARAGGCFACLILLLGEAVCVGKESLVRRSLRVRGFGIAYGKAATVVLDLAQKPMPKLCALVGYYPTKIPAPAAGFPSSLNVVVHLAKSQSFAPKYKYYAYPDTEPGFAEADLDVFDKVAGPLAWSRTLAAVRKGFEIEVDLERIWEEHIACKMLHPIALRD